MPPVAITEVAQVGTALEAAGRQIRQRSAERDRAEQGLREAEERFRATFDQAAVGVAHADLAGRWLRLNDKFCAILGYSHEELRNRPFRSLTHPDAAAGDQEQFERLSRGDVDTYALDKRFIRKDGSPVWVRLTASAARRAEGREPAFVIRVIEDISARMAAEEAIRLANEQLGSRVAAEIVERMKVEEALRQSQKMEAIGQLTGGVAHDFNNLLQAILGNLEALRRRADAGRLSVGDADFRRFTENARRGAERAALTKSLLAFSRRQPLDPKPLDVNKLVNGMSELLHRTLGERIATKAVLAGGLWRVFADANQLENALLNLAVNARDPMPRGGKLIIETANVSLDAAYAARQAEVRPGQYVMIAVSDTGTGMSRDVLARVFEPFFTTKDVSHGTGLGLSQVYGFVKQSGGHVQIYSEPGDGTTVKLYLPRLEGAEPGAERAAEPATPRRGSPDEVILALEDNDDVRAHTIEMLRDLGYTAPEASDGPEALRLLKTHPEVRVLFTDIGLPGGLNGRELAGAQRGNTLISRCCTPPVMRAMPLSTRGGSTPGSS